MNTKNHNRTLRVAFPSQLKATDYEPTNIGLDYEYIFLENVFSPVVEIMADGSIEPGVAEKFDWVQDELKLTNIRELIAQKILQDQEELILFQEYIQ